MFFNKNEVNEYTTYDNKQIVEQLVNKIISLKRRQQQDK